MGESRAGETLSLARGTLDTEVQRFLDECLDPIRDAFAPEALVVFGSRVSGTPDRWSDIDIVLVSDRFSGVHPLDRLYAFDDAIRAHRHVDVFCLTPEEFERRREGPTIVAEAVRTGVHII